MKSFTVFSMRRKMSLCAGVVVLIVGSLSLGSASADLLTLPNPSFETDVLGDSASTSSAPTGGCPWRS